MSTVYIFLDEGGNFDFSRGGTTYFTLTSVTRTRPFLLNAALDDYKYDLLEYGKNVEYFHASEDNPHVRGEVFDRIVEHTDTLRVDSLIVEKPKTGPALRAEHNFYPKMLGYLLRHVIQREATTTVDEIIVVTDSIPVNKKRKTVEKAVKLVLAEMLPGHTRYRILHHDSKAHYGLQVADYCNWAIYRKWSSGDTLQYDRIKPMICSEFEIFRGGATYYY